MQVIPIFVLLIVTVRNCHGIDKTITTSTTEINHRKLPLFPRINIKFVVNSRTKTANVDQETTTKKPLMPKIIPKTKIEVNLSNRATVTRKPLMKVTHFAVQTIINRRLHKPNDDKNSTERNYKVNANNSIVKDTSNDLRPKSKENVARGRARNNRLSQVVASTTVNYFKEEHKDRKEFIFLDSKNDKRAAVHDLLQMDVGDLETTTAKIDVTETLRPKRSVNVIEEENRVTATPLRKYADHDVKLNNDRFYKNVNS